MKIRMNMDTLKLVLTWIADHLVETTIGAVFLVVGAVKIKNTLSRSKIQSAGRDIKSANIQGSNNKVEIK